MRACPRTRFRACPGLDPGVDTGSRRKPEKTATWSADARRKRPFASKSGSTIPRPARPAQQAFEARYRSQDKSAQIRVLRQIADMLLHIRRIDADGFTIAVRGCE